MNAMDEVRRFNVGATIVVSELANGDFKISHLCTPKGRYDWYRKTSVVEVDPMETRLTDPISIYTYIECRQCGLGGRIFDGSFVKSRPNLDETRISLG
ncbi:hypothetical protein SEA_RICKMORE_85 [Gordonia phage Rickmore]|uniref:Uncharacterized protein n=1 Tax=Gordonia phage Rickmore TaxID=2507854 RepID=A0A410TB67_9CAUD|nr:hypothetical protein HWC05_gp85 [Gordonia phage Rickmore]QAU06319.1 hypothetical protein SEA_RICKMORE_85 [Gordonia phage Rickmore]